MAQLKVLSHLLLGGVYGEIESRERERVTPKKKDSKILLTEEKPHFLLIFGSYSIYIVFTLSLHMYFVVCVRLSDTHMYIIYMFLLYHIHVYTIIWFGNS